MAQRINKSKSKGTSFGKKSGAEKAFRSKKKSDDSFGGERKYSSGSSSFSKPFRKAGGEEGSRAGGFSKSRPDSGAGDFKKPFQKREGGSFGTRSDESKRFSKPFRSEGGEERPFRKTGSSSSSFGKSGGFRKSDGDFKRPFKKREGDSFNSDKPRFSKPFRSEGGEEKPFRKTGGSSSFGKPSDFKKSFKKSEGDSDKPKFSKPFRSDPLKKPQFPRLRYRRIHCPREPRDCLALEIRQAPNLKEAPACEWRVCRRDGRARSRMRGAVARTL